MSQCHERFYKQLKVTLVLTNVTLDEIAAIKQFLVDYRKKDKDAAV